MLRGTSQRHIVTQTVRSQAPIPEESQGLKKHAKTHAHIPQKGGKVTT